MGVGVGGCGNGCGWVWKRAWGRGRGRGGGLEPERAPLRPLARALPHLLGEDVVGGRARARHKAPLVQRLHDDPAPASRAARDLSAAAPVVVVAGGIGMVGAAVRRRREEEQVRVELAAVRRNVGPRGDAHAQQCALHLKVNVRERQSALLEGGGVGGSGGGAFCGVRREDQRPQPRDTAEDANADVLCDGRGPTHHKGGAPMRSMLLLA